MKGGGVRREELELAVHAAHPVPPPAGFLDPLLRRDRVRLAAVSLQQHLAQQRLLLLRTDQEEGSDKAVTWNMQIMLLWLHKRKRREGTQGKLQDFKQMSAC